VEHCGDEFPEDELAARLIEVLACVEEAERILTQLSQLAVKSGNFWGGRGEFLRACLKSHVRACRDGQA